MRPFRLWICSVLLGASTALAADFVGPEACKTCHPEAYEAWRGSKHARALDSLTPEQKQDARCVSCHAPDLKEQETAHVSCETCHGGGKLYSPSFVMKDPELARLVGLVDPSEKSCRTCHDDSSPSLRPFDFEEKLKLIDHWSAERARRSGAAGTKADAPRSSPHKSRR